jgi:hypothetical protein
MLRARAASGADHGCRIIDDDADLSVLGLESVMQKVLLLMAWVVLVAWAIRPVPGRGIPAGHGLTRIYIKPRQAVLTGIFLVVIAAVMFGLAINRRDNDFLLVGLGLGWLGGLYVFHGRRKV